MSSPISLREQEPWKTTRLIGRRCTRSNALSRPVLIARGLDGFYPILSLVRLCSFEASGRGRSRNFSVAIARGKHLFPFRTEKLSLSAPMVLGPKGPGRVGRRRLISTKGRPAGRPFVVVERLVWPHVAARDHRDRHRRAARRLLRRRPDRRAPTRGGERPASGRADRRRGSRPRGGACSRPRLG